MQGRVARALADSVHGDGGDGGAVVERAHGVVGPETEVVVEVDDQRLVGERGHDPRDVVVDALGSEEAHGVGEGIARSSRLVAGPGQLDEVGHVGARAVFAPELHRGDPAAPRVGDGLRRHADVGLAVEGHGQLEPFLGLAAFELQEGLADLVLQVEVGARGEDEEADVVGLRPHLLEDVDGDVDVARVGAAHHHDLEVRAQPALALALQDQLEGAPLGDGGRGEAHVEDVQAGVGEEAGELVFLLGSEGHARGLLAVAQGGVVEADLPRPREGGARGEARGRGDQAVEGFAELDHGEGDSKAIIADGLSRAPIGSTEAKGTTEATETTEPT